MSKNPFKNIREFDVPESPLGMLPSHTHFMIQCYDNDECYKVILKYIPKLQNAGGTDITVIKLMGFYGALVPDSYTKAKELVKSYGSHPWTEVFFEMMDKLREIMAPCYEDAVLVESETLTHVVVKQ